MKLKRQLAAAAIAVGLGSAALVAPANETRMISAQGAYYFSMALCGDFYGAVRAARFGAAVGGKIDRLNIRGGFSFAFGFAL